MSPEIRRLLEDKFFVAGQMDAQGHEAEKWKTGSGGPVLAMSRRLLQEAREALEALLASQCPPTDATSPFPDAVRYAVALMRNALDVASPYHAPFIQAHIDALLAADPSPADPQPEVRTAAQFVFDTFSRDEAQGYRSKDRQFAIKILGKALAGHLSPEAQKDDATR